MEFFNCLSIDPDTRTRLMLKHAMSLVVQFDSIYSVGNERAALELLSEFKYDLVFVSDKLGKERISKFIKQAKKTEYGEVAGYILLCSNQEDSKGLTNSLLEGADGMLLEPYSIDSLEELSLLAAKIKAKRVEEKRKAALSYISSDVLRCVDLMSQAVFLNHPTAIIKKTVKNINNFISNYENGAILNLYLESLADAFSKVERPVQIVQACRYRGPSQRIKKQEEKKIIESMESSMGDIEKKVYESKF